MSAVQANWYADPQNKDPAHTIIVRCRTSKKWVELRCPSCHGNAVPDSTAPGGFRLLKGLHAISSHAQQQCGLTFERLTPDEVVQRCLANELPRDGVYSPKVVLVKRHNGVSAREQPRGVRRLHRAETSGLRPGDLETTQVLYEGNHQAWEKGITFRLERMGIDIGRLATAWSSGNHADELRLQLEKAAREILRYISPRILAAVKQHDRKNAADLLPILARLAKPFRFLDLPPELRNRVYEFAMPCGTVYIRRPNERAFQQSPRLPPLITMVSKQVRSETLAMWIARSNFEITFDDMHMQPSRVQTTMDVVHKWAQKSYLRAENAGHLRKVTVIIDGVLGGKKGYHLWFFELTNFEGEGLRARAVNDMGHNFEAKQPLQRLVDHVDRVRRSIGGQGDAIVMALTMIPRQWDGNALLGAII